MLTKNKGFTFIELVFSLAILGIMTIMIIKNSNETLKEKSAVALAQETMDYAKISNRYIKNHYQEIYNLAATSGTPVVINWQTITAEEKQSVMKNKNRLGMIPCVYINNSGNQLIPYLYFVRPSSGTFRQPEQLLTNMAMKKIGAQAGYLASDGNAYGIYKGWQTAASGFNSAGCQGNGTVPNTLVINMSYMMDARSTLESDYTLHRPIDNTSSPGDPNNANTMTTDLYASTNNPDGSESPHRIVFNSYTNTGLQAANSYAGGASPLAGKQNLVVVRSGDNNPNNLAQGNFVAKTVQPTAQVSVGQGCDSTMLGAIANVCTPGSGSCNITLAEQIIRGQMQCTYNVLFCQGVDPTDSTGTKPLNGYCWLPITSIDFLLNRPVNTGNANSDQFAYSADCSQAVGRGFFILPGSVQYGDGPSPDTFGNHPNYCCHWNRENNFESGAVGAGINGWTNIYSNSTYNVNIMIGTRIVQKWGAVKNSDPWCWTSDCGNQYSYAPVMIKHYTCTNDTTNFTYTGVY